MKEALRFNRGRSVLSSRQPSTRATVDHSSTSGTLGSATFASEFLILLGAFQEAWWLGTIASLAIVLAAMYMLRWISAILHDREGVAVGEHRPHELAPGAFLAIAPLVIAILALSVWPFGLTERVDPTTTILTQSAAQEVDAP